MTNHKRRQIYITEFDLDRLEDLIEKHRAKTSRDTRNLDELEQELGKAEVVSPESIPPDVITMNSRVRLEDADSGHATVYTLVFPADADVEKGKISILAPIGTAMIGYRVGDKITWDVPGGQKNLAVKEILYQPESAGDYHL
ncbi:nucleoside diphosphate kinase regulator [Geobacter sp. DSM 9736]|uniref:nucleoside diphosphate kinase regulator n=1 Tax=Geobacter sp. DSM 9736 TaxID=1277350 RepID=UPI000B4FFD4D|nr:nucleoside diphosphate kinase regulator [Geobacter sp. DSM 9736]SNB46288.1 GreA/GreB family elongation factor [Geobacter sp. DSM 9736]